MTWKFGKIPAPAVTASLALCAVVVAGCGGGNDSQSKAEASAADAPQREHAQAAGVTGKVALKNVQSGKCVAVTGGSSDAGAKLVVANCTNGPEQQFELSETSAGIYKLAISSTGKVVDVENASASDNAPWQQWVDNGTPAQRFTLTALFDGVYSIANLNSKKCAQLSAGDTIKQQACSGTDAQQFRLVGAGTTEPPAPPPPPPAPPPPSDGSYVPLFPTGNPVTEQLQYTEADGTLVTFIGMRGVERHARERGEEWTLPDVQPGRYLTYPHHYFQNRTFGLVVRDEVPAGRQKITISMRVNDGTFNGTTFSLFRNVADPTVRDFGWALNYGFNNPKYVNQDNYPQPVCLAGQPDADCQMVVDSNWRTNPEHSKLKIGDPIELAPAPRLDYDKNNGSALIDGGGARYYSFEQLYVVGQGLRPWYGVVPNLDSAPIPDTALSGGQTTLSYNYSEEPMRVFQQMANNIGIQNAKRFVEGRRLFHTSFADGKHSEFPNENPVFNAHANQLGPRYNQVNCIGCHELNGRSTAPTAGSRFVGTMLAGATPVNGNRTPDPTYGLNILQLATATDAKDFTVNVDRYETTVRTFGDGEKVELQKPVYSFKGPVPAQYSARQAPQVVGMGLLEALPESAILALSDPSDKNGDGVRGIPNLVTDPESGQTRVGRFGWKAAKASVRHQTAEALVNDMGVVSPVYPSRRCQQGAADCRTPEGQGVSEQELQRLTQYIELLAVPAQRSLRSGFPSDARVSVEHDVNPQQIERGATVFAQVSCTSCHTPSIKTGNTHPFAEVRDQTIHPYSNLLLHDMGPGLADTLAEGKAQPAMWRTAPLWGLGSLQYVQGGAQNVRYLHDGRARTLNEAILWHAGEADNSRKRYEALSRDDRNAVIAFLNSL